MTAMNFEKIRISLIAVFFLVAIFPLSLLSRKIVLQGEYLIKEKASAHLIDLAKGNVNALERFMNERINDIQVMSKMVSARGSDRGFVIKQLENMRKQYRIYPGIVLSDSEGRPLIGTKGLTSESILRVERFIKRGGIVSSGVGDVEMLKVSDGTIPAVIICSRLKGAGGGYDYLCGIVDFRYVNKILKESEIGGTGEVYIVNKVGYFLTASRFGARILKDKYSLFLDEREPAPASEVTDYRGHKVLHTQRKVGDYPWYVIAEQDKSETLAQIVRLRKETLFYVFLITVVVFAMSYIVSMLIVNTLKSKYRYEKELEFQVIQKDKLAALGLLSAGLAHELNTPLANALLYVQIAREELKENEHESLDDRLLTIEDEVKHGGEVVKNLLGFSHSAQDGKKSANVNDVISKLLSIAGPHCESKGLLMHVDCEEGIPNVAAEKSTLQEIITNIVVNAIDTMQCGGDIRISTRYIPSIGKIRIDVSDTGPGIPKDAISRIFDPFYTTKKPGEGTGLGLFMCYQMVRKLGGDIKVVSKSEGTEKTGTTFTVELPAETERSL